MEDALVYERSGITHCIPDLTVCLAGRDPERVHGPFESARKLLDLTEPQADALFNVGAWPPRLRSEYNPEPVTVEEFERNARVAAEFIDSFIEVSTSWSH